MNGFAKGRIVNDDLRMIDWVPDGDVKLRPRTFTVQDVQQLTLSPDLFARKFDSAEDSGIFDLLERHLNTPQARRYRAPVVANAVRPHPLAVNEEGMLAVAG